MKKVENYLRGVKKTTQKEPKAKKVKRIDENVAMLSKVVVETLRRGFKEYEIPESVFIRSPQNPSQKYSIPINLIVNLLQNEKSKEEICDAFKKCWEDEGIKLIFESQYILFDFKFEFLKTETTNTKKREEKEGKVVVMEEKKLTVELEEDKFTEEKYELYKLYQKNVHNENDVTQEGFIRY